MTRNEYMEQLKQKLKRLPKEEFDKAIEYFEEYFADAGEENTAEAIENLGSPQVAAEQIIREIAIDNSNSGKAKTDVKKGISGVWIAVLAVLASPIALPVAIAIAAVLFAFVAAVAAILFAIGISGIALAISAPLALVGAGSMIIYSIPVAMVCLGLAFVFLGFGVLLVYASYLVFRKFLNWIIVVSGKHLQKGGKKNEEK